MPATETAAAENGDIKLVPLARITQDPNIQVRVRIDNETVDGYSAIINEHGAMEPMVVFVDSMAALLADPENYPFLLSQGHHRLLAYRKSGKLEAPAQIREGGLSEALEYAIRSGARSSLPLSNADKRRAAELAVKDPRIGMKDDRRIAKMIGISSSLVGECRRGIKPEDKRKPSPERHAPSPAPAARSGNESPAPPSAASHERRPKEPAKPSKAMVLRQIQDYLHEEIIDEDDLAKLMDGKDYEFQKVGKPGMHTILRVVGKTGREQCRVKVVIKDITKELIQVKYDDGKLVLGD